MLDRIFSSLTALLHPTKQPNIVAVNSGTSFGLCFGYCYKEVRLNQTELLFVVSSHDKREFPDKKVGDRITEQEWTGILQLINTDAFRTLPNVIGCPDCLDGGAEWVDISFNNGESKKVAYEYAKPPEQIKALAGKLALIRKMYSEKLNVTHSRA